MSSYYHTDKEEWDDLIRERLEARKHHYDNYDFPSNAEEFISVVQAVYKHLRSSECPHCGSIGYKPENGGQRCSYCLGEKGSD